MKQLLKNPRVNWGIAILCLIVYLVADIIVMMNAATYNREARLIVCIVVEALAILLLLAMNQQKNPLLGTLLSLLLAAIGIYNVIITSCVFYLKLPDEKVAILEQNNILPPSNGIFWLGCIVWVAAMLICICAVWLSLITDQHTLSVSKDFRSTIQTLFWIGGILFAILAFLFVGSLMKTILAQNKDAVLINSFYKEIKTDDGIVTAIIHESKYIRGLSENSDSFARWGAFFQTAKPFVFLLGLNAIKNIHVANEKDL